MSELYFSGAPVGSKLPHGSFSEAAEELQLTSTAVSLLWRGKNRPGESTARALALKSGKHPDSWRDGYKDAQPEAGAGRLIEQCAFLGIDQSIIEELNAVVHGVKGMGGEKSDLPDPLKRAVIAAVHLLGFPIEQVTLEAAALHRETVRRGGAGHAKHLTAQQWHADLATRLSGKKAGSGTRPKVALESVKPEG
jgi:hypothetical protein